MMNSDAYQLFMTVSEPGPGDYAQRSRVKQIARIIKYLREELELRHPHLAQPTGKMIDCLVANCPPKIFNGDDWEAIVMAALEYVQIETSATTKTPRRFTELDGTTPLFPNSELFDEVDAHQFSKSLLTYLRQELLG